MLLPVYEHLPNGTRTRNTTLVIEGYHAYFHGSSHYCSPYKEEQNKSDWKYGWIRAAEDAQNHILDQLSVTQIDNFLSVEKNNGS